MGPALQLQQSPASAEEWTLHNVHHGSDVRVRCEAVDRERQRDGRPLGVCLESAWRIHPIYIHSYTPHTVLPQVSPPMPH